ncbi:MAG TPA: TolC family protein, partial [Verrucomicrobiae bacterium]|nr:TolC family protein [Verrucomicrobiae bacterium]
ASGAAPRADDALTYAEALDRAVRVDERLGLHEAERGSLEARRRAEGARLRPALDLATEILTNNTALDVQIGGPGARPRTLQDTLQGDARLEARWDFYQPARAREQDALTRDIEASRSDLSTVEAQVRYETAGAYLDALQAAAATKVAAADLDRANAQARLGRDRLAAGEGSALGVKQLDLAVDAAARSLAAAAANEDLARERLRHLLQLGRAPILPAAADAGLPAPPAEPDPEALVATALGARTEVGAARGRAAASRERVVASAASRRPDAGVSGAVIASTVEGFDGKKIDTRLQAGLRWTFFDSGERTAVIERRTEEQRAAELTLAAVGRKVETEVRQAVTGLRIAGLEASRSATVREQARAALDQAEALYGAGSATESDIAERRADLAAAEGREEAASVARVRALVALRFAVGASLPPAP